MNASRVSSSKSTNRASWIVEIAMPYSPGRYPGVCCSSSSALRSDSPAPGLTWKKRLNSFVGPAARPGREAPVAAVVTPQRSHRPLRASSPPPDDRPAWVTPSEGCEKPLQMCDFYYVVGAHRGDTR